MTTKAPTPTRVPRCSRCGEFRELLEIFAGAMLEWNLEDDNDVAVPITVDAIMKQDIDFIFAIIKAWGDAVGGVSGPLADGSTSGAKSLEASMGMETLSSSHLN